MASFRRHLRAAVKAPRTIELYSHSVRYFSRWLAEHERPAMLDELARHAVSAWLAELAETCQSSVVATRLRATAVRGASARKSVARAAYQS